MVLSPEPKQGVSVAVFWSGVSTKALAPEVLDGGVLATGVAFVSLKSRESLRY